MFKKAVPLVILVTLLLVLASLPALATDPPQVNQYEFTSQAEYNAWWDQRRPDISLAGTVEHTSQQGCNFHDIVIDPSTYGPLTTNSSVLEAHMKYCASTNEFWLSWGSNYAGYQNREIIANAGLRITNEAGVPVKYKAWDISYIPEQDGALNVHYVYPSQTNSEIYHFVLEVSLQDTVTQEGPIQDFSWWLEQSPWQMYFTVLKKGYPPGTCTRSIRLWYWYEGEIQEAVYPFTPVSAVIHDLGVLPYGTIVHMEMVDGGPVDKITLKKYHDDGVHWNYQYTSWVGPYEGIYGAHEPLYTDPNVHLLDAGRIWGSEWEYLENGVRCLFSEEQVWDPPVEAGTPEQTANGWSIVVTSVPEAAGRGITIVWGNQSVTTTLDDSGHATAVFDNQAGTQPLASFKH